MTPQILITRPKQTAETFADQLRARLGQQTPIILSPLLLIEFVNQPIDLAGIKTLIFTSAHAVLAFAAMTHDRNFRCYTVGPATAHAAKLHGFDSRSGPGTGAELVEKIASDGPPTPCLYLRGDHVAYDLADALNASHITTRSAVVYRQVAQPLTQQAKTALSDGRRLVVPIFSPRTADLLFQNVQTNSPIHVAAISDVVAQKVPRDRIAGLETANVPNNDAMLTLTEALWHRVIQLEGQGPAQ